MFKGIFGIHCLQAKSGDKRSADGVKKTEKGAVSFLSHIYFIQQSHQICSVSINLRMHAQRM